MKKEHKTLTLGKKATRAWKKDEKFFFLTNTNFPNLHEFFI